MGEISLIKKFRHRLSEDGIVTAFERVKWYISSTFKFHYWKRSSINLSILYVRIKILQLISSNKVTDADPFKIIFVDPSKIQYEADASHLYKWGEVAHKTWELTPIEDRDKYQTYKNYVNENAETPDINQNKEDLVQNLQANGYIPQKNLRPLREYIPFHYRDMEIGVHINKNGEFIWAGWGRNRLCASKVLGLDEVAVQVHQRHKDWQELRDDLSKNGLSNEYNEELRDHPDLQDILN